MTKSCSRYGSEGWGSSPSKRAEKALSVEVSSIKCSCELLVDPDISRARTTNSSVGWPVPRRRTDGDAPKKSS